MWRSGGAIAVGREERDACAECTVGKMGRSKRVLLEGWRGCAVRLAEGKDSAQRAGATRARSASFSVFVEDTMGFSHSHSSLALFSYEKALGAALLVDSSLLSAKLAERTCSVAL